MTQPDWTDTEFEVEPVDPERAERMRQLNLLHTAWVDGQQRADVPFEPNGRPTGSDYNEHTPDLEADAKAQDDFAAAAARILAGVPL